jgi:hypothetical protein
VSLTELTQQLDADAAGCEMHTLTTDLSLIGHAAESER